MTVNDLHRAVDTICDAWYRASAVNRANLKARVYDRDVIATTDHADPTGEAVVNGHAPAWFAELHDVAVMFVERMPQDPETLRHEWHRLFTQCPTGWSQEAIQRMYRLANQALIWFPAPTPALRHGDTDGTVTVGERTNTVALCHLCRQPAPAGRDEATGKPLVHIVPTLHGDVTLHASTCYYRLDRRAREHGMSIGAYLSIVQAA